MVKKTASWDLLLLVTAVIWGFAFVAQRVGMDYMGPYAFNGIRFALGAFSLVPFIIWQSRKQPAKDIKKPPKNLLIIGGLTAGVLVFFGASFQQVGLMSTTAGNAGFITGLYMVIVPVMGLAIGQRTNKGTIIGITLAVFGLYFLSVTEDFTIAWGDVLVLIGAFFWAAQVLVISYFSPKLDSLKLAFLEFLICSILSMIVALAIETITWEGISGAAVPLLYGGLASVGVAYTIQVFAQKKTHPSHASIIMGMEAVFAVIGGWMFLNEMLSFRGFIGCGLMLAGMIISQLWGMKRKRPQKRKTPLPG
ncbi:MAG: DMT family transporter [Thermoplasmata archaeon]|nr:DMT family transporter [Thermoplasmata archaeon]